MLDIIVTSSCRKTIVKTTRSFFDKVRYSDKMRFIVHIDVLNNENLSFITGYLRSLERSEGIGVDIHINNNPDTNWHDAHTKAINFLFNQIEKPYYFHLEDDWEFLKNIDLNLLIELMGKYDHIDHIRFSKEKIKDKYWLYHISDEISEEYLAPNVEVTINGIPLVQTPIWSFNPHLGRSSIIKNFINMPLDGNPEKYICHKYPELAGNGKTYLYGRIGDSAYVKDLGRNRFRRKLQKYKYILTGGKYAEYRFD